MSSQYIQQQIEIDRPTNAAAVSVALLAVSFAVLLFLRLVSQRSLRRQAAAA
jgi:sulfate transport system permease protein